MISQNLPGDDENGVLVQVSGGASSGGAAAAAADGESNATAQGTQRARLMGFNGTTWDRLRTAVTTISSTLTGFLNTLPWALYHSSPVTRTDNQGGPLETDATGNLRSVEQFAPKYEDNTAEVAKVEHRYTNARVTASGATNAIKTGAGLLHSISVDKWVTGLVIDVYDALTVTGTPIRKITLSATDTGPMPASVVDITFATGLTVNLSAAADVGISYR
jgi:hypothetical protein